MSSLVMEIQQEALTQNIPISNILRKALVVAKKLKISEFETWILHEINGYENSEDIPGYRRLKGMVKAWNPYHGWQPVIFPDGGIEEKICNRPCGQSVAEIENLMEGQTKDYLLQMPFPASLEQNLRKAVGENTQISLFIPYTSIVRILDAVRTSVLTWALRLEEDGILGEGLSFTPAEKETANKSSYNVTNFFGSVQNSLIQQDSNHSVQISSGHQQVDSATVLELLNEILANVSQLGLETETEQELRAEVDTVKTQLSSPNPKPGVIKECLGSARRIIESAGGGFAAQLLLRLSSLL